MNLFELELVIQIIVKDLKRAQTHRHTQTDLAWDEVDHALDHAIEVARQLEDGWGDGGDMPS
ncbi:MAG: hypothetical protein DRJ65_22320 [Acidobacteria bacterium]|nr:MAG: hypothetical protein DRJ65_22320 [Acidobacteriota bacterium]